MKLEIAATAQLSEPPVVRQARRGRPANPAMIEAAALARSNPGQWVQIAGEHAIAVGSNIQRGARGCPMPFRGGTWEATIRRRQPELRRAIIWVRFMGESA